ncbi:uncharacterized protein TNCV_173031 [Trichonephila clavipes]|nr:uncharacterized protein TNCV_173031 [Trichonephila clavipes]
MAPNTGIRYTGIAIPSRSAFYRLYLFTRDNCAQIFLTQMGFRPLTGGQVSDEYGRKSVDAQVAAVAEWYRHRIVAGFVTSSIPVPLKTRRVGQRCTLNLSRAETSSRWCGVVVRKGGASSGVVHVT